MDFSETNKIIKEKYGKEITREEFIKNVNQVINDIDFIKDISVAVREKVKTFLVIMKHGILKNTKVNISTQDRKLVINILNKLAQTFPEHEEEKKYIDILTKILEQNLDNIENKRNNNNKFNTWW